MTDLFVLLLHTLASIFRSRRALILENLRLRQQLQWHSARSAGFHSDAVTDCFGSSSGGCIRTGGATSSSSGRRRSFAGTGVAGDGTGNGDRGLGGGVLAYPAKCAL